MLIKRLEVKGFKSLRDVVWEPGPLTVIIGPNGSGKTNIISTLTLLQHSVFGKLDSYISSNGGFYSLFWDAEQNPLSISSLINIQEGGFSLTSSLAKYHLTIEWPNIFSSHVVTSELLYAIDQENSGLIPLIERYLAKGTSRTDRNDFFNYQTEDKSLDSKESLLSKFDGAYNISKIISLCNYSLGVTGIFKDILTSKNSTIRRPQKTKYIKFLEPDGQNLVNVLHTLYSENRNFEEDINTAMRAAFGDDFDRLVFPPAADQLVQLRIRWKSLKREQSMFDLSDGTIRFLFLMTVLCNPDPPPLIAIDEPETGLHPSMFPIIAEYAAEAAKRTQVIFSTHSPQFLDAFSDFDVTTTVTNWRNGETTVKNLDGDTLKKWLEHYKLGSLFLSGDLEALA